MIKIMAVMNNKMKIISCLIRSINHRYRLGMLYNFTIQSSKVFIIRYSFENGMLEVSFCFNIIQTFSYKYELNYK